MTRREAKAVIERTAMKMGWKTAEAIITTADHPHLKDTAQHTLVLKGRNRTGKPDEVTTTALQPGELVEKMQRALRPRP